MPAGFRPQLASLHASKGIGASLRYLLTGGEENAFIAALMPLRGGTSMSYEEALRLASRDERFRATVYAMNTLLMHKGVYAREEFEHLFVEWVHKEARKKGSNNQTSIPAGLSRA